MNLSEVLISTKEVVFSFHVSASGQDYTNTTGQIPTSVVEGYVVFFYIQDFDVAEN